MKTNAMHVSICSQKRAGLFGSCRAVQWSCYLTKERYYTHQQCLDGSEFTSSRFRSFLWRTAKGWWVISISDKLDIGALSSGFFISAWAEIKQKWKNLTTSLSTLPLCLSAGQLWEESKQHITSKTIANQVESADRLKRSVPHFTSSSGGGRKWLVSRKLEHENASGSAITPHPTCFNSD